MKILFLNNIIYAYAKQAASAVGGAERQQWLLARHSRPLVGRYLLGTIFALSFDRTQIFAAPLSPPLLLAALRFGPVVDG